jgi:hypothetical protein
MRMVQFIKKIIQNALLKRNFRKEFILFKHLSEYNINNLSVNWDDRYPCFSDKTTSTAFDGHYVYHTAWAARILKQTMPVLHVDISSSLYFCSIVSAFIPVAYYDYRPPRLQLDYLKINHADITTLPFKTDSIKSLSCMHVVEHIGLGRYGDPLDPGGDIKAIDELKRVLSPGGDLLIVVPIGVPKVMFNAHRIYSYDQIVNNFKHYKLVEFAFIPDDFHKYGIIRNAPVELTRTQKYGCGCFWFKK